MTNATLWIIAANIFVFALTYLLPELKFSLALIPGAVLQGYVWQIFSYMFVHANPSHLLLNMLGLFFFGARVEKEIGSREFLLYYFLTGFLAGLFSLAVYLATGTYNVALIGASGAVFAVELAYATIYPESEIYIWAILPVRAPILVLGFTAIELFSQILGVNGSVAHLAHLAGFGFGWIYFLVRFDINPARRFFK
jgi:membrane associated rhomboid family serine protease